MIIYTNFMGNTNRTVDDTELDEDAMREYFRNLDYNILGICGKKLVRFVQKPKKTNTTIYVFNIAAFFDDELGFLSHLSALFSLYDMRDTKYIDLYNQFVKEGEEPVSAVKRVMRKIEDFGRREEYELWRKIDKNVSSAPGFIKIVLVDAMRRIVRTEGTRINIPFTPTIPGMIIGVVFAGVISIVKSRYKSMIEKPKKKFLENYNKIMQEIGIKMLDEDKIEKVIEKFKNNNVIVMKIDESDSENNEGGSVELKYFEDLDNAPLLSKKDEKLIQTITFWKEFYRRGLQFLNYSSRPFIRGPMEIY